MAVQLTPEVLAAVFQGLEKGGTLTFTDTDPAHIPTVSMALMVAGFTDVVATPEGTAVTATKPTYDLGAAVPLRRKAAAAEPAKRVWTVAADDEDIVDEDALLDGDVLPERKAAEDCSTKPRACKNCSCGRAEVEAAGDAPVMTDEELAKSVSSCGNCYKGDAFRCGSCPFLGKPAFKPGTGAVKLDLTDDF